MTGRLVIVSLSLLIGLFLTWGTGMFLTPLAATQIDVVNYGAPLTYSTRVIPTQFLAYNWLNLVIDLAFWVIIAYIVLVGMIGASSQKKTE